MQNCSKAVVECLFKRCVTQLGRLFKGINTKIKSKAAKQIIGSRNVYAVFNGLFHEGSSIGNSFTPLTLRFEFKVMDFNIWHETNSITIQKWSRGSDFYTDISII